MAGAAHVRVMAVGLATWVITSAVIFPFPPFAFWLVVMFRPFASFMAFVLPCLVKKGCSKGLSFGCKVADVAPLIPSCESPAASASPGVLLRDRDASSSSRIVVLMSTLYGVVSPPKAQSRLGAVVDTAPSSIT